MDWRPNKPTKTVMTFHKQLKFSFYKSFTGANSDNQHSDFIEADI